MGRGAVSNRQIYETPKPEQALSILRLEVVEGDQTWLKLLGSFYVVVYFVMDACLLLLCLF